MSKSPRITTYASLATAATTVAVGGSADAATVVNNSLFGTTIGWNTGAGQTSNVTMTGFAGLAAGAGFKIATQAAANGRPVGGVFGGFVGAAISWQGAGSGKFRTVSNSTYGRSAGFLANFGSTQGAGSASKAVANVNRGSWSTSFFDLGNQAFTNTNTSNPNNSRYLLFNFSVGGLTYYGWIEVLSMTVTPSNTSTNTYSVTLGRWAYDDQSGYQLFAGEIRASAVPGGAGLAALALGAAGVRGRRRSRN